MREREKGGTHISNTTNCHHCCSKVHLEELLLLNFDDIQQDAEKYLAAFEEENIPNTEDELWVGAGQCVS